MTEMQVYASYAWKVEEQTKILDKLKVACSSHAIRILRDKNEIGYRESIQAYMNKLVAGDAIILVLSDAYFKSQYCMYELCEIYKHKASLKQVYPIVTAGTRFHKAKERIPYIMHWEQEVEDLNEGLKSIRTGNMSTASLTEMKDYEAFARMIDDLQSVLGDMNALTEDIHLDTDFAALIAQLKIHSSNVRLTESVNIKDSNHSKLPLIDRLPTVNGKFFGRVAELNLLKKAWNGKQTKIIQFIAPGGTGKTKLLRHWLDTTSDINALIAWSFHSQGSSEDKQTSAEPFFTEVLKKLGSTQEKFDSEEARGEHLAELLQGKRFVLILDGLEPLQHARYEESGKLKDRAVRQLLRYLARHNDGLCIITTRTVVHDLTDICKTAVISCDLQNLNVDDSERLLRTLGVKGRTADLQCAAKEYGCHALALILLGNILRIGYEGDVLQRNRIPKLLKSQGNHVNKHAFKVMQAYETWFAGQPELRLLQILGLFDHPIGQKELQVLWDAEIPNLTDGIEEDEWFDTIAALREEHHLIYEYNHRKEFDCHPLVHEYFGKRFQEQYPSAWRKAHTVLYEYYKSKPQKELPSTLEEMRPLFHAVTHACKAGDYLNALAVYYARINQGSDFLTKSLFSSSENLALLSIFFDENWKQLNIALPEMAYSNLVEITGGALLEQGRVNECIVLLEKRLANVERRGVLDSMINQCVKLAESFTLIGQLKQAVIYGEKAIQASLLLKTNNKEFFQIIALCATGEAYHQLGNTADAKYCFLQAALIQIQRAENEPDKWPYNLLSIQGFQFCQFLLDQHEYEKVYEIAREIYKIAITMHEKIDIRDACLGSACLALAVFRGKLTINISPLYYLDYAVNTIRTVDNYREFWPVFLLFRCEYFRINAQFAKAYTDLQEVYEIAEPSSMRLYLTDYHLEMARLLLAENPASCEITTHVEAAARLINETGYHRRDAELADLQAQLQGLSISTV